MNAVMNSIPSQMTLVLDLPVDEKPYQPSENARKAFAAALEKLAMAPYREMPESRKQPFRRGFMEGFDEQKLPVDACYDLAIFDGFCLGQRLLCQWDGKGNFR